MIPNLGGDQIPLVLEGDTWAQYLSIEELFMGSRVGIRYLDYQLEIEAPVSEEHEHRTLAVWLKLGVLKNEFAFSPEVI